MGIMNKLKLTTTKRENRTVNAVELLRSKLTEKLDEQLEMIQAEQVGKKLVKTKEVYITNEAGERIAQKQDRRMRKWYWADADGTWYIELRYGNKVLKLAGNNTAIEVGDKSKLADTIKSVKEAVTAGELDKALANAKKERMATLRKNKVDALNG